MLSAKNKPTHPISSGKQTDSTKQSVPFNQLEELDLRKFMEEDAKINDSSSLAHQDIEFSENISYSLGLLAYSIGLFIIAYWVLVTPKFWLLTIGIAAIGIGIHLFLNPLQFKMRKNNKLITEQEINNSDDDNNLFFSIKM